MAPTTTHGYFKLLGSTSWFQVPSAICGDEEEEEHGDGLELQEAAIEDELERQWVSAGAAAPAESASKPVEGTRKSQVLPHLQLLGPAHPSSGLREPLPGPVPAIGSRALACPPLLIWRCRDANGLFSMFSVALGHLAVRERMGQAVLVDWSSGELLYQGPDGEPNLWNAFFRQPAELRVRREVLLRELQRGRYMETQSYSPVFGLLRGVVQGFGFISPRLAEQGRTLCARHIALRGSFEARLRKLAAELLGSGHRWLAVHVRRGDKAIEAKANFELSDDAIVSRICVQCRAWHCSGVFLCSDDASLKKYIEAALSVSTARGGPGLTVKLYPSVLSSKKGQAAHLDKSLQGYQKAEDIVTETFLMARGCHGLLSTLSNVSASAVYLSPSGYPFTTFWQPPEQLPIRVKPFSTRWMRRIRVLPVAAVGA